MEIVVFIGIFIHFPSFFLSTINGNNISLVVYYEVPIGQRDEIKRKFANLIEVRWLYKEIIINKKLELDNITSIFCCLFH